MVEHASQLLEEISQYLSQDGGVINSGGTMEIDEDDWEDDDDAMDV